VSRYCGTTLLAILVIAFVVLSRHWPVVNDSALMHYVVLLQQHGLAPYSAIHDINLPGAYLPDWMAMKVSGGPGAAGDYAWRVYDLGLLAVATGAMIVIALPFDWFAGVVGGGLFALFHGRDGIGQAGQRDLAMAVLFLVAAAALLVAGRRERQSRDGADLELYWLYGACGLALGMATTIKPFGAAYLVGLLVYLAFSGPRGKRVRSMAAVTAGFALPLVVAAGYLVEHQALRSFFEMCRVALPFHGAVVRTPLTSMLHSASPRSFLKLGAVALAVGLLRRSWRSPEIRVVLAGMVFGFGCYFAQDKGYSYQRYPYSAFLLLWVGLECTAALRDRRWLLRVIGTGGLLFGICVCAPTYLRAAYRAQWQEPYLHAIERDLQEQGGRALDGRVQCIDSISGCVNVLYRMGLKQATGTLYDEFLFPPARLRGRVPEAVGQGRQAFLSQLAGHPPQVFLVSSWLFPAGPGGYAKLDLWPAFAEYLAAHYRLVDEQRFQDAENGPLGFRMYVRR
jgi:hypothetical protein